MLKKFLKYFKDKTDVQYTGNLYYDFLTQLGGKQFGDGLFNSFSAQNVAQWQETVGEAYPQLRGKFQLFGYDWMGTCFGIDLNIKNQGNILMFEIGTGKILGIPCNFEQFLNREIPKHADAVLAEGMFRQWKKKNNTPITYGNCVGYQVPLFLGGADNVNNLELSDMDVYWSILGQIKNQI